MTTNTAVIVILILTIINTLILVTGVGWRRG